MIDDRDLSESTLRYILWKALKDYSEAELIALLSDNDYIVRTAAAKQLHMRPSQEVFSSAIKLSKSQCVYEREIGAFLISQLGTPKFPFKHESVDALMRMISDSHADVRVAAIFALGHLFRGDLTNNALLISKTLSAAKDESISIRISVAFALASFPSTKEVLDVLDELCADSSPDVREWAELSREIIEDRQLS